MYVPAQFSETRRNVLVGVMRQVRFALFITHAKGAYHATHAPAVVHEAADGLTIETHFARANDHCSALGHASLAIFQGPQAYISPGWYASKAEDGKVVPTWNYVVIHAEGVMTAMEAPALLSHLAAMTDENEAGRTAPWSVEDAPEGYIPRLSRAIVGVRLKVDTLKGAFKLAQHKPEADRRGAATGLLAEPAEGARAIGSLMAKEFDA
ncbi:MAG: FMN-binding negative transcriptional regulator [Pseudomonadota bacterium]